MFTGRNVKVMCRQMKSDGHTCLGINKSLGFEGRKAGLFRLCADLQGWQQRKVGAAMAPPHYHRCGWRCIAVCLSKVLLQGKPSALQTLSHFTFLTDTPWGVGRENVLELVG